MQVTASDRVDRIRGEWQRERPDLDVSPQGIIGRLHRLAGALTTELVAVYADHGLGEGDFDVLCALRRAGEPYARRPADVAKATMLTTGAVTKRLDSLERRGLVRRQAATDGDLRTKQVALTAAGRRLIDEAFTEHIANEHRLLELLSERDRRELEPILRRWLAAVDDD